MTPARLFVILTALFAALATYFIPEMDASGDEPHYLVMAQSLWREHDLDLRDNYAREDWREFRDGPTEPHYAAPRKDGRPFPGHAPGLPLLLAPVYALGGRLACAVLLGAMVAGVGALAYWIALTEGLSMTGSLLAGLMAAGPPLAAFALHIYTEAPSALALFAAYALLRFGRGRTAPALAATLACALPFLHPKMALGSVAMAFAAFALRARVSFRVFAGVTLVGLMFYGLFWMSIFGAPTGLGPYGGVPEDTAFNPAQALVGLLVDRAYGLLPIAPVFAALFFAGRGATSSMPEAARTRRLEMVMILAVLLPALLWRMWWGGQSPPARFIAPLTPFLALAAARLWDDASRWVRVAMTAAVVWSWTLFLFSALQPGRALFINKRIRPTRLWNALWPGGPLDGLLPDMARPESSDWTVAFVWVVAFAALTIAIRRRRSARVTAR